MYYFSYVRHTLMLLMRRVADMLREHSAYMELPPKGWLEQRFPGISWKVGRSPCIISDHPSSSASADWLIMLLQSVSNSAFTSAWYSYSSRRGCDGRGDCCGRRRRRPVQ